MADLPTPSIQSLERPQNGLKMAQPNLTISRINCRAPPKLCSGRYNLTKSIPRVCRRNVSLSHATPRTYLSILAFTLTTSQTWRQASLFHGQYTIASRHAFVCPITTSLERVSAYVEPAVDWLTDCVAPSPTFLMGIKKHKRHNIGLE